MRSALALAAALVVGARAAPAQPTARPSAPPPELVEQLDAEAAIAARARDQVLAKQHEQQAARVRRARLAYKLLRGATSPLAIAPSDRLAIARARSTARLLLARDQAELALLADEVDQLTAAMMRIASDRARAAPPPAELRLRRPAVGTIVRRFGALVHDDSRATLARRGIDLEVARGAEVIAPADGVVRYAGPIRGLDHGVVLDCGGVWLVLGKLGPTAVAIGDQVEVGARLGVAARTRVYLEVRVPVGPGGRPIDPEPLLGD